MVKIGARMSTCHSVNAHVPCFSVEFYQAEQGNRESSRNNIHENHWDKIAQVDPTKLSEQQLLNVNTERKTKFTHSQPNSRFLKHLCQKVQVANFF